MPSVIIGKDTETGQAISIGDIERRSGLYILGRPGSGKTTMLKTICTQDIVNGHGVFFLDPHGDAIDDLQKRIPAARQDDVIVLDPADEQGSFGINLLACSDPQSMTELTRTFAPAIEVFKKLFANLQTDELDILLNQYLRNSFFPLIANQGYTLSEIPLFLSDKQFRDRLLQHPSIRPQVVRFWHDVFDRLPQDDQRKEIASTLRRIDFFEDYDQIRHIIGQSASTLHFSDIMDTGKILFVKLSQALPPDVKRIIGTILISNLVHAVLLREQMPEEKRRHFCIFVDEFQNFASSDDFAVLFTQARKYAIATTIAHQERYGQFADNKRISGATDAAVNKIFFQVSVRDAQEQAPEFADNPEDTKTRMGGQLVPSPHVIEDIWERGHADEHVMRIRERYFWLVDLLKQRPEGHEYIFDPRKMPKTPSNPADLNYGCFNDWLGYRSSPEDIRHGLSLLNKYYYDCMRNGFKVQPRSDAELQLFLQIIDCFSGVYGFRQTMEPYISDTMRQEFVRRMSAKQDREIMDIKRRIQEGLLYPEFKHADLVTRPSYSPRKPYEVDLLYFVRQENPALLRKWFVDSVPQYFLTDLQIAHWTMLGREVFTPSELEEFIVWQKRLMHSQEMKVFAELVRVVSDIVVDEQRYKANKNRLYRQYTAIMAQPLLFLQFGEKHNELPFETTEPYLRVITERVVWQLTELQCFLIYCFGFFPSYLFNNPIKIQSAQYDEEPKREKTQGEMIDIMAQELIDLRPHTAYVKSAWKGKIQTVNVERAPELRLFAMNFTAWKNAIDKGILRPRSVIEEEIRERQENWRKRRGNEPPPPTHTGGNTPPSSGSAGNDREPPPTHSISEKPPEEKPAGSRDVSHQGTGAFTQPATEEKSMLSPPRTSLATTPSRQTPSVKLVYLRFFESGKGMPAREQRQYSTSFPQQTARFINFELHMVNLQYEQCDQSFQLLVHYYNPDGSLLREYQTEWVLPSSYKAFTYPYGWGEQELGYWKPGIYHVKILINGVEVADGSFTIKEDRDRVEHASASKKLPPSPALEFVSLRFFESVKGIPPDMWQRRYGTGFRQGTTRYINFDLTMRNGLYRQRNEKYLLNVRYYNPDGSLLIQGQEDILIRSDSGQLIYQYGQGWEEPGYWGPGTYRVEILIDGVKFAEGSFRIE